MYTSFAMRKSHSTFRNMTILLLTRQRFELAAPTTISLQTKEQFNAFTIDVTQAFCSGSCVYSRRSFGVILQSHAATYTHRNTSIVFLRLAYHNLFFFCSLYSFSFQYIVWTKVISFSRRTVLKGLCSLIAC